MAEVAGLMSKTIQYTYGVIGALESSTTRAMLFVPGGAPAQLSGGVSTLALAQVYRRGIVCCGNAPLLTVITLGVAIVMPEPKTPHPPSGTAHPSAAAAAASRRARPARPGRVRSTCHLRCPILGPDGSHGVWAPKGRSDAGECHDGGGQPLRRRRERQPQARTPAARRTERPPGHDRDPPAAARPARTRSNQANRAAVPRSCLARGLRNGDGPAGATVTAVLRDAWQPDEPRPVILAAMGNPSTTPVLAGLEARKARTPRRLSGSLNVTVPAGRPAASSAQARTRRQYRARRHDRQLCRPGQQQRPPLPADRGRRAGGRPPAPVPPAPARHPRRARAAAAGTSGGR